MYRTEPTIKKWKTYQKVKSKNGYAQKQGRIQKNELGGPIQGVTSGVQWWRQG